MYTIKSDWSLDIDNGGIPWSIGIGVIDYNVNCFALFSSVLNVVNEIYFSLGRRGINADLYEAIGGMVEKLNNLVHFEYTKDIRDEDVLVNDYLGLFKTFEYRKLSSFKKETSIKVHKVQYISKDIIKQLEVNYKERFNISMEDIRDNYKGYYIGDLDKEDDSYPLISCCDYRKVISVIPNTENNSILKALLEVFNMLTSLVKDVIYLEKYYHFELTKSRVHKEIAFLVDNLLQSLSYTFNSTSFRENEYYVFDRIELERRVGYNLEERLSYIENVIRREVENANL